MLPILRKSLNLSNRAQTRQCSDLGICPIWGSVQFGDQSDLGINPNEPDSAAQPIRAQRASNETSALVVYFLLRWSKAAHFGCPSGPILRTLDQARTLSDLIHSKPRMRSYTDRGSILVFSSHFIRILIKPSFIELIRFSSKFVLGHGIIHLPVWYVVLYRVPFNLSWHTVNLLPLRY